MKPAFAVVGCGHVGTALAKYLALVGYRPQGFASKSLESAQKAATVAGFGGNVSDRPWEVTGDAGLVLITTPDSAIRSVAEQIAEKRGVKDGAVILHCSGALSSEELISLKNAGAAIGSIHPLQSFAEEDVEANPFSGIMMGVEGQPPAVAMARQMAKDLGATPFEINTEGKILYHASAVVASNYLVTLMNLAFQLLFASGVRSNNMVEILKPLIRGTLSNIEVSGIPRALTGPIARGDVDIVRAHIEEIGKKSSTLLHLYKTIGEQTIDIATAKGSLSEDAAEELKRLLTDGQFER